MMSSVSDGSSDIYSDKNNKKWIIQIDGQIKGYSDNFDDAIDYCSSAISEIVDNYDKDYFVFAEEESDKATNLYFIKILGRHRYMCNPGFHTRPLSIIKMELINAI
jgi:hypothetical protein